LVQQQFSVKIQLLVEVPYRAGDFPLECAMDGIRRQLRMSHGRLSVLADRLRNTQDDLMSHDFMIGGPHSPRRSVSLLKFAPIAEVFTDAVHQYNRELSVFQDLLKTVQREQPPRQTQSNGQVPVSSVSPPRTKSSMSRAQMQPPMQTQSAQAVSRKPMQSPQTGAPPNIARKSAPSQQRQARAPIARQPMQPMQPQTQQPTQPPMSTQRTRQPMQAMPPMQPQQRASVQSQREYVPSSALYDARPPTSNGVSSRVAPPQNPRKPPQHRQQPPVAAAPVHMMMQTQPPPTGAMADEYSEDPEEIKRRRKAKKKAKKREKAALKKQSQAQLSAQVQPQPPQQPQMAPSRAAVPPRVVEPAPVVYEEPFVPPVLAAQDPDSDGFDVGDHHELHAQNQMFETQEQREENEEKQRKQEKHEAFMATRVKYDDIVLPKEAKVTYSYGASSAKAFQVTEGELADEIFTSTRLTLSGVKDMESLKSDSEEDKAKIRNVLMRECKFKNEHISEVHIKDGKPWCIVHVRCSLKTIKNKLKKLRQRNNKKKKEGVDYSKLVSLRLFVRRPLTESDDNEANRRLYVLNFDVLNKKCHRAMTNLFLKFGDLAQDVVIGLSRDKKDPFAFVEYKDKEDAKKVWKYQNINGEPGKKITFGNRELNIQYSNKERKLREQRRRRD